MLEYALVVAIVVGGLLAVRGFMRRGIMYKYKEVGDGVGFGRQAADTVKFNLTGIR